MPEKGYTSRGGRAFQDTNWVRFRLAQQTRFIHCGSAPLTVDGGTCLSLRFAKEDVAVSTEPGAPRKFILAFPLLDMPPGSPLPEVFTLSKPCRMLWSFDEMPNLFIFTLDAGTEVWAKGGVLNANQEVAMAFDIEFSHHLIAEYRRRNTPVADRADVVP